MYIPKKYCSYQKNVCVFCGKTSTVTNAQGLLTCIADQRKTLEEKKCACGEMLELKQGKYGPFFLCRSCGPMSLKKSMDSDTQGLYKTTKKVTLPDGRRVMSVYDLEDYSKR